jgi:hypothetical protein
MKFLSLHEIEHTQGTVQLTDRKSLILVVPIFIYRRRLCTL